VHRFLNSLGGYVRSVNTYSSGALRVILPRILGLPDPFTGGTTWPSILENARLVVAFGGMALKNNAVSGGGVTRHRGPARLREAQRRGIEFVLFSPLEDDLPDFLDVTRHAPRPGTDTAIMLALTHCLIAEDLHDAAFLERYCAGFERYRAYLMGEEDGQPKDADWAAGISGVAAPALRDLARRMAGTRTFVNVSLSLQRAQHGEQPVWAAVALAAALGQIGLPGGGFGAAYGCFDHVGCVSMPVPGPTLPQGENAVADLIPVARVADMLLHPGEEFDFDGRRLTYPDIRLVYWAGGNPFHHHQDLNRLREAVARTDTIVVHEPFWTGMARHADIVLPSTTTLERDDIGAARADPFLVAMRQVVEPVGQARNDYGTFAALAARLGAEERFTEGRSEHAWLEHLYERWRAGWQRLEVEMPDFEEFWARGRVEIPEPERPYASLQEFRADPDGAPLRTPSGRIEIFSDTIEGFGYPDCPGHPTWLEADEWLGSPLAARFPLQLVANNPATRLHSQLDAGATSQASKVAGREPVRLNPPDARARGIADGDLVRLFNDRGSCLAGAVLSPRVREGVVQLSTGAWYDPEDPATPGSTCVGGNPNVLTRDVGTSRLAQGCSGQLSLVEAERFDGPPPPSRAYDPPPIVTE
jgi:biotin/methionine sulfoxide reductase